MSEPFLSKIRMFGFNYAPRGWAMCDGQLLPINQNQALYSLLGTMYGGDGRTTFALPDLRGRTSNHTGQGAGLSNYQQGQRIGVESVALSTAQIPNHTHGLKASGDDQNAASSPTNNYPAAAPAAFGVKMYHNTSEGSFAPGAVSNSGGGLAHNNMQPTLVITFCIALQGTFPPRN